MNHSTGDSEGLELKTGLSMLGRKRLPVVEAFLWLVNIALVFLTTRYLFRMNSPGVFWGFDGQSFLALFGVQHRLSDVLFGLGGDFAPDELVHGETFNVASGEHRSIIEIARDVVELMNYRMDRIQFIEDRPGQVVRHTGDWSKINSVLGWKPL